MKILPEQIVTLALGAFILAMIFAAPVMNQPANHTITPEAYFGEGR